MKETLFLNNIRDTYNFFRKLRIFNHWFWSDLWYRQVDCRIIHRNQWLIDSVPRTWLDKDTVFLKVIYAGLVNFIDADGEDCFNRTDWTQTRKSRDMMKKLKEIHHWIKVGRDKKLAELDAAYPKRPKDMDILKWLNCTDYKEYTKVEKIEKFIDDTDSKYLVYILKNRSYLWT